MEYVWLEYAFPSCSKSQHKCEKSHVFPVKVWNCSLGDTVWINILLYYFLNIRNAKQRVRCNVYSLNGFSMMAIARRKFCVCTLWTIQSFKSWRITVNPLKKTILFGKNWMNDKKKLLIRKFRSVFFITQITLWNTAVMYNDGRTGSSVNPSARVEVISQNGTRNLYETYFII